MNYALGVICFLSGMAVMFYLVKPELDEYEELVDERDRLEDQLTKKEQLEEE
jgi:hypothetical protein